MYHYAEFEAADSFDLFCTFWMLYILSVCAHVNVKKS